jgi:spermidine synthase
MLARLRFYWVVAGCGAVLMALEILASRVLAPHFGNSVYVWGSIISVFLAALSLGYLWGGRLADREPSLAALGRLIALAAVCEAVLLLAGPRLAAAMGEWTGHSPGGTLIAASVLFGPVSVLLAAVSPYAVRLAAREISGLGNTAGRLYALSTLGSLAGTLGSTFLLIPFLTLPRILELLLALTALTALVALGDALRREVLSAALALLLVGLALFRAARPEPPLEGRLYERVTPYQTLVVREEGGVRTLESDRIPQAAVSLSDGEPALRYARYAAAGLLVQPEMRTMLVMGLGGGSIGRYLQRRMPGLTLDYVDIDPVVPVVARRFLGFEEGPRTRVAISDARSFLSRSGERWDYILGDTYIGLSVPFHLTTREFLTQVRGHLAPGGVYALNLAAGLSDPFSLSVYRTVSEVFPTTYVFQVRGAANVLVLGTEQRQLATADLRERARALDRRFRFDPMLREIAGARIAVEVEAREAPILTDEFAPVDRLIRLGVESRETN